MNHAHRDKRSAAGPQADPAEVGCISGPSAADVVAHAQRVFRTADAADMWLRRPNRALGDRVPAALLSDPKCAHDVDVILGRIEHGIIS